MACITYGIYYLDLFQTSSAWQANKLSKYMQISLTSHNGMYQILGSINWISEYSSCGYLVWICTHQAHLNNNYCAKHVEINQLFSLFFLSNTVII